MYPARAAVWSPFPAFPSGPANPDCFSIFPHKNARVCRLHAFSPPAPGIVEPKRGAIPSGLCIYEKQTARRMTGCFAPIANGDHTDHTLVTSLCLPLRNSTIKITMCLNVCSSSPAVIRLPDSQPGHDGSDAFATRQIFRIFPVYRPKEEGEERIHDDSDQNHANGHEP